MEKVTPAKGPPYLLLPLAPQLQFLNHCLLCLQPQQSEVLREISQANSSNIKNFHTILNYLTGNNPTNDEEVGDAEKDNSVPVFQELPPLCQECYDMVGELNNLHQLLLSAQYSIQKQTEKIRSKVTETCPNPFLPSTRQDFNDRISSSGMSTEESSELCGLINKLHDAIILEGKNQVVYPSRPPLGFTVDQTESILSAAASASINPITRKSEMTAEKNSVVKPERYAPVEEVALPIPSVSSSSLPPRRSRKRKAVVLEEPDPLAEVETEYENEGFSDGDEDMEGRSSLQSSSPAKFKSENVENLSDEENDTEDEDWNPFQSFDELSNSNSVNEEFEEEEKVLPMEEEEDEESATVKESETAESHARKREKGTKVQLLCDLCGKTIHVLKLAEHLKTHVKSYVTKCPSPNCYRHFSCPLKLENLHLKNSPKCVEKAKLPKEWKIRKCTVCDGVEFELKSLKKHLKVHEEEIQEKNFPCPIPGCNETYGLRQSVEIHLFYHDLRSAPAELCVKAKKNPIKVKPRLTLQCDLCGKRVAASTLAEHLKTHVESYVTKCPNPICHRHFSCPLKLEKLHLNQTPECVEKANLPKKTWRIKKCSLCDDVQFNNLKVFRNHLNSHEEEIQEKNFACPVPGCNKMYGLRQSVEIHLFYHDLRPPPTHQRCFVCLKNLEVSKMEAHLKDSHQITGSVTCKFCKILCPDQKAILEHIFQHRDEEGAACDLCEEDKGIKYLLHDDLRKHYFHVHNIGELKSYVCEHCALDFSSSQFLMTHQISAHPGKVEEDVKGKKRIRRKFYCDLCPCDDPARFSSPSNDKIYAHKIQAHGADPFLCKQCGATFTSDGLFRKHAAQHKQKLYGIKTETFKCEVVGCGKIFRERSQYHHHQIVHSSSYSDRPFKCDSCDKRFFNYHHMKLHNDAVHLGIRRHICDICGRKCASKTSLTEHKLTHTGERPHKCPNCEETFRTIDSMQRHKIRKHSEELGIVKKEKKKEQCHICHKMVQELKKHMDSAHNVHGVSLECTVCSQTFKTKSGLQYHRFSKHSGRVKKTFPCMEEGCGKVLTTQKGAHRHQLAVHSSAAERPYQCEYCEKGYVSEPQLKQHQNSAHLGIRSYICHTCGDGFTSSTCLKNHKLIHTGERPFNCPICNQAFRHKGVLQTHIKAHEKKGSDFKPNGPMKHIRKRVDR